MPNFSLNILFACSTCSGFPRIMKIFSFSLLWFLLSNSQCAPVCWFICLMVSPPKINVQMFNKNINLIYIFMNQYNFTFSNNDTTFWRWNSECRFYFILHRTSLTSIPSTIFIWISIIAKSIASWTTSCSHITSTIISSLYKYLIII